MRALTPDRSRHLTDQHSLSSLLAGSAEGHDALGLLVANSNPASGSRSSRCVASACAHTCRVGGRRRSMQNRRGHFAQRDQRPAETQLRLPPTAPRLRRQRRGQRGLLAFRHKYDRGPPGAPRHLVVGVGQQRPCDRRPCLPVPDLGQRVQRLAPCLRTLQRTSRSSPGSVMDAGWRVSAQVSMSRTKNSGSIAQRSTSLSTKRGSGVVPTAERPAVAPTNDRPPALGPLVPHPSPVS
ncbi:hypothetical protein SHIRM173S_07517 [Streptomyces hirsutus]